MKDYLISGLGNFKVSLYLSSNFPMILVEQEIPKMGIFSGLKNSELKILTQIPQIGIENFYDRRISKITKN